MPCALERGGHVVEADDGAGLAVRYFFEHGGQLLARERHALFAHFHVGVVQAHFRAARGHHQRDAAAQRARAQDGDGARGNVLGQLEGDFFAAQQRHAHQLAAPVVDDLALAGLVEVHLVDAAREFADEGAAARQVQRQADGFVQVGQQDFVADGLAIDDLGAIERVALGWLAAVGPVHGLVLLIPFEVDGLGQVAQYDFDVAALRRVGPCRQQRQRHARDAAFAALGRTLLRPVEPATLGVHRHAHAVQAGVEFVVARAGLHVGVQAGAVELAAHHAHAFAVAPVQALGGRVEDALLAGDEAALGQDGLALAAVEVAALNLALVLPEVAVARAGRAHEGVVAVLAFGVNGHAIGLGYEVVDQHALIGAVGGQRQHARARPQAQDDEAVGGSCHVGCLQLMNRMGLQPFICKRQQL